MVFLINNLDFASTFIFDAPFIQREVTFKALLSKYTDGCKNHHTITKLRDNNSRYIRAKYKPEVTWIRDQWKKNRQCREEVTNRESLLSSKSSFFISMLFSSLISWNSPQAESRQNVLRRNRDNTSLYKVVARWWDLPIRRCCPIWRHSIVPPSCSTPTVVAAPSYP